MGPHTTTACTGSMSQPVLPASPEVCVVNYTLSLSRKSVWWSSIWTKYELIQLLTWKEQKPRKLCNCFNQYPLDFRATLISHITASHSNIGSMHSTCFLIKSNLLLLIFWKTSSQVLLTKISVSNWEREKLTAVAFLLILWNNSSNWASKLRRPFQNYCVKWSLRRKN